MLQLTRKIFSLRLVAERQRSREIVNQLRRLSSQSIPSKPDSSGKKVTVLSIRDKYQKNEPIAVLTAHDYPSARFCEEGGVDVVLVGDSLGMVALGYDSTIPVTMQEMLHHCRAVSRGAKLPLLVGDMPFGSYNVSIESALDNALKFIKEGNMEAVKLEGGRNVAQTVERIVQTGIPVVGHVGLTPQSLNALGGYRIQGKTADKALMVVEDALELERAGCFMIVLEAIPEKLANFITQKLNIPTIGIGAGNQCSGQVLVQHDMLGSFDKFVPRFCKQYANLNSTITSAISEYVSEVKSRDFPQTGKHTYPIEEKEWDLFITRAEKLF